MSTYIKLSTFEYPRHIGDIELDSAGMADYAHVKWVDIPVYNAETQRCEEGLPQQIDGEWHMTWTVRDATPEEIEQANNPINPFDRNKIVKSDTSTAIIKGE
jgi:hypothetical protein